jgi:hypothetical protein
MIYGKISITKTLIDEKIIRRIQSNIDRKGFQVETKLVLKTKSSNSRTY